MLRDPVSGKPIGEGYERGKDPDGSFIADKLHDRPIAKFIGSAVVGMISMRVAGDLIRRGGKKGFKLAMRKADTMKSPVLRDVFTRMSTDIDDARKVFDEWEGVFRASDGTKIPMSHYLTPQEMSEIRGGGDPIGAWSLRDRLQSKLVSQARRLPYELPALYMSQRAPGIGTDHLFGYGDDSDKNINWYNPIDVMGDFARQSSKNLMTMVLPIEAGPTVLKGGLQKIMQHAEGAATSGGKNLFVNMDQSLKMLGHSASDIIDRGVDVSRKSTAAFSAGIGEAVRHNRSVVEVLDEMRTSSQTKAMKAWAKSELDGARKAVSGGDLFGINSPVKTAQEVIGRVRGGETIAGALRGVGMDADGLRPWGRRRLDALSEATGGADTLDLVRPVGAAKNFFRGFRGVWSDEIGGEVNRQSFGFGAANKRAYDSGKRTFTFGSLGEEFDVDGVAAIQPTKNTFIEQVAYSITSHVGRGSLTPTGEQMRGTGTWYGDKMREFYKEELVSAIGKNKNLDKKTIEEIVDLMKVKRLPNAGADPMPISNRIGFGDLMGDVDSRYSKDLSNYMERLFPGAGKDIVNEMTGGPGALGRAEESFLKNRSIYERKVEDIWSTGFREQVVPFAKRKGGSLAALHEELGDLTSEGTQDFLTRTTAEEINRMALAQGTVRAGQESIATVRAVGGIKAPRSVSDIRADLAQYGFETPEQMRNFLVAQKRITREGSMGFNALGLRRLSAEDALDAGFFGEDIAPTVRSLLGEMNRGSSSLARTPVGAVWQTKSGSIVDLSHVTTGARRMMDSLGENFHIPFIRVNPITLFGGEAERTMADTPIFRFHTGNQPFTNTGGQTAADAWVFMREKRSKGTVARVVDGGTERLAGWYRSSPTDSSSMLGRHVRMAIGDGGQVSREAQSDWARRFSLDPDKSDSLIERFKRGKAGRGWRDILRGELSTDLENEAALARALLDDSTPSGKKLAKVLAEVDSVGMDNLPKASRDILDSAISGYRSMESSLRTNRFNPRITDKIAESLEEVGSSASSVFSPRGKNLGSIETRDEFLSLSEGIQRDIWKLPDDSDRRTRLQWAYDSLVGKHANAARGQSRYFEGKSSSQALRRKGIFRRMDEARDDLVRFGAIREGIMTEGGDGFGVVSQDMLSAVERLRKAGTITKKEYTEARAAVFSMQLGYDNVQDFSSKLTRRERIVESMKRAAAITEPGARGVLDDVANARIQSGALPSVRSFVDRHIKGADYSFDGVNYNPFGGDADNVFIPTFGTVAGRSRSGAVSSVLGLNTWSSPDNFSGMSIPVSHGVQRLEGFVSPFGLGLNESDFRGPLDWYTRGLIGKRVLPLVAGGTVAVAVDRTLGGMVRSKDDNDERVYAPLFLGSAAWAVKEAQIAAAALPGGVTPAEKRYELEEGEVAVRKGRWWPLGNTPWRGDQIEYYRPSWYRRFMSGQTYTSDTHGSPMERLMYGHDFSPLRPLDPYHYDDKHETTRPYPVTGDYFTGPWGPLTEALNLTAGKVLKPTRRMHEDEVNMALASYVGAGEDAFAKDTAVGTTMPMEGSTAGTVSGAMAMGREMMAPRHAIGSGYSGGGVSGSLMARRSISASNQDIMSAAATPAYAGGYSPYGTRSPQFGYNADIMEDGRPITDSGLTMGAMGLGYRSQEMLGLYGFTFGSVREYLGMGSQDMSPRAPVLESSSYAFSMSRGFWDMNLGGLGDIPPMGEGGFGGLEMSEFVRRFIPKERKDITRLNPIRNDMGRMHDWLPGEEYYTNFKEGDPFSKVEMGEARLPGIAYERFNELHSDETGRYGRLDQFKILADVAPYSEQFRRLNETIDSYVTSPEDAALIQRVRTQHYRRTQKHEFRPYIHSGSDYTTRKDTITGIVEPGVFTTEKSGVVRLSGVKLEEGMDAATLSRRLVGEEVSITTDSNIGGIQGFAGSQSGRSARDARIDFDGTNINQLMIEHGGIVTTGTDPLRDNDDVGGVLARTTENLLHKDNIVNRKFFGKDTSVEKWERRNVYGSTFPEWQSPVSDFLMPSIYKSTNRGPLLGAVTLGTVGSMFGATARGRVVGMMAGSAVGFGAGLMRGAKEHSGNNRFMPEHREKELAVEEYADILSYVRSIKLRNEAAAVGNASAVKYFDDASKRTMYGADLDSGNIEDAIAAIPKRKRPYFEDMLRAPEKDRGRILSTAGRLERRILQTAWGMPRERRPDLGEYFKDRELPGPEWEGWDPSVEEDYIKIKVANSIGLDLSQMGYYPDEIRQAHAVNPAYPNIMKAANRPKDTQMLLQRYLMENNLTGYVVSNSSFGPSDRVMLDVGGR